MHLRYLILLLQCFLCTMIAESIFNPTECDPRKQLTIQYKYYLVDFTCSPVADLGKKPCGYLNYSQVELILNDGENFKISIDKSNESKIELKWQGGILRLCFGAIKNFDQKLRILECLSEKFDEHYGKDYEYSNIYASLLNLIDPKKGNRSYMIFFLLKKLNIVCLFQFTKIIGLY